MPPRTAFDSLALILMVLVSGAVSAAPVAAQTRGWSMSYAREHAAVSTNGVEGTWTIDRFSAMWSWVGQGHIRR